MSSLRRPTNLILFTWHDAGDWFGCQGQPAARTPHVDRLAAEGVRFAHCYSACAICSPSRAAIMTGRYCQATGVMGLTNTVFHNRIAPGVPHLGARLRAAGYHTALFGVQHECAPEHVNEVIQPNETIATDPWARGDLLAAHVRDWLGARPRDGGPFFAQIGTFDAHLGRFYTGRPPRADEPYPPYNDTRPDLPVPPYLRGSDLDRATLATLHGQLTRGDLVMGAVLDGLAAAGLEEETLVVMAVDHGVGLDRAKAHCYDSGTHVAWIVRRPGHLPAGRVVEALTGHVDILPTLWELLDLPPLAGLDGRSFAAHARGDATEELNPCVYSHMVEASRGVRTPRWKFIRNFLPGAPVGEPGDCTFRHALGAPRPPAPPTQIPDARQPLTELYDLASDPVEMRNLAGDSAHRAIAAQLDATLWDFLRAQDDFVIHQPLRTAWQVATRAEFLAHCQSRSRPAPPVPGPRQNPVDAASAAGRLP